VKTAETVINNLQPAIPKRRSRSPLDPSPLAKVVSYILLGVWTFVVLFPLYWLVVTSFKQPIEVDSGPFYIPFVDYQPTLDNWRYILGDVGSNGVVRPYINTVVVGIVSATLTLLFGSMAAYALARFQYQPRLGAIGSFLVMVALIALAVLAGVPWSLAIISGVALYFIVLQTIGRRFKRALGNNDIAFWLISQRMLPPVAVVIPVYVLFQQVHLLDTQVALIITYVAVNLPIVVWLMRDYFQNVPLELEECAAVDGASSYRIFWSIVVPVSAPGLVATFLFVLVFAWNEYLLALFLSSANAQTMPLTVAAQNATRGPQWWYMSVLILLMITPVIAMAIALERFISRGILVGAVKG
jgi:multiple sugar transport system permease protein